MREIRFHTISSLGTDNRACVCCWSNTIIIIPFARAATLLFWPIFVVIVFLSVREFEGLPGEINKYKVNNDNVEAH